MKNIFKIAALALMATSLTFVACNNDDDDNTGGNTGGGTNIPDGVTVKFNGESWVPGDIQTINYTYAQTGTTSMIADYFATEDSYFPGFEMYTYQQAAGSETANAGTNGALSTQTGPYICEYYEAMVLTDQNDNRYGDWWAQTVTCDVKAFDLSGMKVSFTVDANMYSAADAFVSSSENYTGDIASARKATVAVSAGNVTLTAQK